MQKNATIKHMMQRLKTNSETNVVGGRIHSILFGGEKHLFHKSEKLGDKCREELEEEAS